MYILQKPRGIDDFSRDEEVECGADVETVDHLGHEIIAECGFNGEVEVRIGDGLKTWECPECHFEHEEAWSREDDIDPDYWRD